MLRELVRKELLETFSSPRFVVILSACTLLILLGLFSGLRNYQASLNHYQAAQSVVQDTIESQVSYEALGLWGDFKVYKPPAQLSAVVEGLENVLGRSAVVALYDEPQLQDSKFNEQPVYAIFGTLDLSFVVTAILSLFAILYTFDAICGERERGTLKLMLANSVPRDSIILGKLIGSFVGLVLPLLVALLAGCLILVLSPSFSLTGEVWARLLLILLLSLGYVTVFLALGVFVSTTTARSSTSFLVLLVVWVLLVFVVPRVAVMAAVRLSDVPSGAEILARQQAIDRQSYREYAVKVERWLQQHPERASLPPEQQVPAVVEDEIAQSLDDKWGSERRRIGEDAEIGQRRQRALTLWLSRLSPTASFSHAAMALAQTDTARQEGFLGATKEYRRQFQDYVRKKMRDESRARALGRAAGASTERLDVSDMPRMVYVEESFGESLERAWLDMVILFVFSAVFFSASYFSFLRYDVR